MSRPITQPVNQVRLTNVATVRLTRHSHRFEVACYRNKIVNYRQGTETDLSEVLQTTRIFTNVSKGQFAKSSLLKECFGTSDEEEVCRFILDKGEVQVSDLERTAQLESTMREVASMVAEKCVHPVSRRPYTMAQIRDAMKGAGFMVHPNRNVKQQFLDCVRLIQETGVLEIERAKMLLGLVLLAPTNASDGGGGEGDYEERRNIALKMLMEIGFASSDFQPSSEADSNRIVFQSDPSLYRTVEAIARDDKVRGRLEIIQQCVTEEGDVTLGSELERRAQKQQLQQQKQQQQQQHQQITETATDTDQHAASRGDDDDNNVTADQLTGQLQSGLILDDSEEYPKPKSTNSRKALKAAQKKSKKAKRRQKEEQAEREERIAAEKARQRERAERLGIAMPSEDGDNDGEDGNADNDANAGRRVGGNTNGNAEGSSGEKGDTKACNSCGGSFTPGEYRAHFRSDWHRYNVKLKMKGVAPVSEKEFLLCDSDAFFE